MEWVPAKYCRNGVFLHANHTVLAVVLWDERRGYASSLPTKLARLQRISSSTDRNMVYFWGAINLKLH